ncbi:MAG: YitT family protein, partial [Candidatus Riflebacteria bacterium]|nr:YitT family protein [Candidatus Riflebacteria bacterium]
MEQSGEVQNGAGFEAGSWLWITFGTLLSSFGYVLFILPLNLFEGGVTGLGIILAKFLGSIFADGRMLPVVGIISWTLTLIIFAASVRLLGRSFGARSIYSTSLLYFSMDIFLWYLQSRGYDVKIRQLLDHELLVASIYGALAIGAGMAIVFN